jgi:hypothetical protein
MAGPTGSPAMHNGFDEEMDILFVKAGLVMAVKATARVVRRNRAIKNLEREAKVIILLLYLFFRINPTYLERLVLGRTMERKQLVIA